MDIKVCVSSRTIGAFTALATLVSLVGCSAPVTTASSGPTALPVVAQANVVVPVANGAITLLPSTESVAVGDTFQLTVQVDSGAAQVDGAEFNLNFDPTMLRIVDDSGAASATIKQLSGLDMPLHNVVDNGAGQVGFAAVTFGDPFPSGVFQIATLNFQALAATGAAGTAISFVNSGTRTTQAAFAGDQITLTPAGATVVISA